MPIAGSGNNKARGADTGLVAAIVGCRAVTIFKELASRPTAARSTAEKIETDPERIAEQLAKALREAGYECVIALPRDN
jgi:hypothetical protein